MDPLYSRSGRLLKKPNLFVPVEDIVDDWATDEHDSDSDSGSDIDTEKEYHSDDESDESDEEDADENGNLKGFVVESESEDA